MAQVGAPIWEAYCPNKSCDREKRLMRENIARLREHRDRQEYERLKAKFGPQDALASAAREGGDVQQAPAESPQSGPSNSEGNAQPLPSPSPIRRASQC